MIWLFSTSKRRQLAAQKWGRLYLRAVSLTIWQALFAGVKQKGVTTKILCVIIYHQSMTRQNSTMTSGASWFTDNNPQLHGKTENGRTIINLENFIDDLENALHKLLQEIQSNQSKQQTAINRYNSIGLLCVGGIVLR
jgi:hypothetical protein